MNKKIIIEGEEFELVPTKVYKPGVWIVFNNRGNLEIRNIISSEELKELKHKEADDKYGSWMSEEAAKQYKDGIERKATPEEIYLYLKVLAQKKGLVKDASIRGIYKTKYHKATDDQYSYHPLTDELSMSGMVLYSQGFWADIEPEPVFTFGGLPVSFHMVDTFKGSGDKEVVITCKGHIGKASELANILTHFFRPMPFGSVEVKAWTLKGQNSHMCPDGTFKIPSFDANNNAAFVDDITIGCHTGKFSELEAIYKHAKPL
jgi:hypothetical protein